MQGKLAVIGGRDSVHTGGKKVSMMFNKCLKGDDLFISTDLGTRPAMDKWGLGFGREGAGIGIPAKKRTQVVVSA